MVKRTTAAGCTAWVAMSVHCQLDSAGFFWNYLFPQEKCSLNNVD